MSRKSPPTLHPFADDSRGPRLQKVMAEAGVASRRACERLIEDGAVTVNGTRVDALPAWVDPVRDHVAVRGRPIRRRGAPVYVMLFKPKGVVTTSEDPEGRRCAIDLVRHPSRERLFAVGRLDLDSSGLLLLTNDGELANRLTHPRYHLPKVYEVTVRGALEPEMLERIERGVFLHDRRSGHGARTGRTRMKVIKRDRDRTILQMEIREGRNRQLRRMLLDVGHPVRKLRRLRMGPLKLTGLRPGQWRDLMPAELAALRRDAFADDRARPGTRSERTKT